MNWLNSKKMEIVLLTLIAVTGFILVNQLANRFFFRLDLTEEKRFSITDATREYLEALDDFVTVEVYLAGELPSGFKRLQQSLLETLAEFKVNSDGKVTFQLLDPNSASSSKSRAEFMQGLIQKGLQPTDVFINEGDKRIQKRIFVGVVVNYGSREVGVQLFKGNQAASPEERLNQSIEGIEYELISAIQSITQDSRPLIGLLSGQLEKDSLDIISFKRQLSQEYRLKRLTCEELKKSVPDLLMLIQPRSAFSPADKYYLDQYIINGGKAIFLLDKVAVNMDSAAVGTYSFPYELELDDLIFRYGIRINNDLVQDYVAGTHPIIVGQSGDRPQIQLLQWPFFPMINNYSKHVITRNLDATKTNFISSIDTVKATGIKKTALLSSSSYSRVSTAPVYVDINILQENLAPDNFDKQNIPVGYLLEGKFTSLYKNRFAPDGVDTTGFKPEGMETGIIVIADGNLVDNSFDPRNGSPLPVGYDPYMGQQFANSDLIMNSIQYLLNGEGVISARAKKVIIRPLDKVKVTSDKNYYRFLNLAAPLIIIFLVGLSIHYFRKRRYTKF